MASVLRGEEVRRSKNKSSNVTICLNNDAKESFIKIQNALISEDIILAHPDFGKDFELVTDASNFAIGAVLSQGGRPISFISRTVNKMAGYNMGIELHRELFMWVD